MNTQECRNVDPGQRDGSLAQGSGFFPFPQWTLLLGALVLWGALSSGAAPFRGRPSLQPAVGSSMQGLNPGDLVFTDVEAAVIRLDRVTAQSSILASGGFLLRPCGLALGPKRMVYVADTGSLAVIAINPATGETVLLSRGDKLGVPFGIAVSAQGEIYVANSQAVLEIDPVDGTQRTVSSGGALRFPLGVAVAPNGDLFVADAGGLVVRIDPGQGGQSIVSAGQHLTTPAGIAAHDENTIYVSDFTSRCVIQLDSRTGTQTVMSAGGSFAAPFGLALSGQHTLFVSDPDAFDLASGIIHVDLRSGEQRPILTGSERFVNCRSVVVVPGPATEP